MDNFTSTSASSQNRAGTVEELTRRLHGGAVAVGVSHLSLRAGEDGTIIGHAVSTSLQIDPLDPDLQSTEAIVIDQQIAIRRGNTSCLKLAFKTSASGLCAVADITLSSTHYDNLLDEVRRRLPQDGDPAPGNDPVALVLTGYLSVASQFIGGRAVARAFAGNVFIYGWREEFGYDSDGMWAKPEHVEPAQAQGAQTIEVDQLPKLAEILQRTMEGPRPPTAPPDCPVCEKAMVRRRAYNGPNAGKYFWGCSDYPVCRGTRPLEVA